MAISVNETSSVMLEPRRCKTVSTKKKELKNLKETWKNATLIFPDIDNLDKF